MNIEKLIENNLEMDGVVIKLQGTSILFLINRSKLLDGIRIDEDFDIRDDQFCHVHVMFTKKNYYVNNFFGRYDYTIKQLTTYSINSNDTNLSMMKIIKDGEFWGVVKSALNL